MKILLSIFLCILLSSTSCKRPDRTMQNQSDMQNRYSGRKVIQPKTSASSQTTLDQQNQNSRKTSEPKTAANLSDLFDKLQDEVFMIYTINELEEVSQGSGFFIGPGVGVTNYHVLEDKENAIISIKNKPYKITSILASSYSDNLDYVIFKTNYVTKNPLRIAKNEPRIGEDIFAIGSPKGLSNSLTKGTVSGFRENNRIQIDATIDHGSSGGPLFNLQGEVIGITSSGMGTGSELNFAVNIQVLPYEKFVEK